MRVPSATALLAIVVGVLLTLAFLVIVSGPPNHDASQLATPDGPSQLGTQHSLVVQQASQPHAPDPTGARTAEVDSAGAVDDEAMPGAANQDQPGRGYPHGTRPWVLDYTLREFLGEQVPDPQWQGVDRNTLARLTVGMSIAAILDALGRSIEDSASYQYPRDAGVHSFFYNGKNYEFSRGEFPVYDALQDYFKAVQEWDVAASAESALENRPTIGAELEGQIKVFAEEAMGYLSQGDW